MWRSCLCQLCGSGVRIPDDSAVAAPKCTPSVLQQPGMSQPIGGGAAVETKAALSGPGKQSASMNITGVTPPSPGTTAPESDKAEMARKIVEGFKINGMVIRNADTGKILWQSPASDWEDAFKKEVQVEVPRVILSVRAISREMSFSSKEKIQNFRLVQTVILHGNPIEEWRFDFGFVIPGSTNTWQCVIESGGADKVLPASILSGNVIIETSFFDGDLLVNNSRIRLFYV